MATKRKKSAEPVGNSFFVGVGLHNNFFRFDDLEDDQKVILMAAHLEMMQNLFNFCKEKKDKCDQDNPGKTKDSMSGEKQTTKINAFKEKLTTYFGEFLPSHVVDSLCHLVEENSYDKCHYCSMPTESLVLSVLQILVDASQCTNEAPSTKFFSKAPAPNNNHDSFFEKSISTNRGNAMCLIKIIHNGIEGGKILSDEIKSNAIPILDTPVFLLRKGGLHGNTSLSSQQAPAIPMNPKSKPNHFIAKLHVLSEPSSHAPIANSIEVVSPEVLILKEKKPKASLLDLGKKADQLYNQKNVNSLVTKNNTHSAKAEMRYYNVLFGLAKSQWSSHEGVMLYKTSVTYNSLGESIEPFGHVDNFFIAGYCRKLFDDSHPRESRKHFFYPRIGLCFPIFHAHAKHWSVFILDLKLKIFAFLDSMFGENDGLQIHTRDRIIPAFKVCWYEHAEVKLDLEDFSVLYPPVPKQNNIVDLRSVFDQSDVPNIRVKLGNALFSARRMSLTKH